MDKSKVAKKGLANSVKNTKKTQKRTDKSKANNNKLQSQKRKTQRRSASKSSTQPSLPANYIVKETPKDIHKEKEMTPKDEPGSPAIIDNEKTDKDKEKKEKNEKKRAERREPEKKVEPTQLDDVPPAPAPPPAPVKTPEPPSAMDFVVKVDKKPAKMDDGYEDFGPGANL
uniref:Uncharacterized protein n=1 Tax=Caenorhabditis japonica TaxID=281687 RepID=A0A8R1HVI0_CAEJA